MLATSCLEKTVEIGSLESESSSSTEQSRLSNHNYILEAFMVKRDADRAKMPKHRYFSVDGRPISSKRGIGKKLLAIYLGHINGLTLSAATSTLNGGCFIRLNVKCPVGSYDVNIEPSKDDVLFADEALVLRAFEGICKDMYTPTESGGNRPNTDEQAGTTGITATNESGMHDFQTTPSSTTRMARKGAPITSPVLPSGQPQLSSNAVPNGQYTALAEEDLAESPSAREDQAQPPTTSTGQGGISEHHKSPVMDTIADEGRCKDAVRPPWNVDMSVDFSHRTRIPGRRNPPPRLTDTLTGKESVLIAEQVTEQASNAERLNPWIIAQRAAKNSDIEDAHTLTSEPILRQFEPPLTPEPPVLRHAMAPPVDLDVPPGQRHLHPKDRLANRQLTVPGGPYRSPLSSPQHPGRALLANSPLQSHTPLRSSHRYPPWTPPTSIEKDQNTRGQRTANGSNSHSGPPDKLKQSKISFNNRHANRRRREIQQSGIAAEDPASAPVPHGLATQGARGQTDLEEMFTSARRSLNYQISQAEAIQQVAGPGQVEHHEDYQEQRPRRPPFRPLQANTGQDVNSRAEDKEPIKTSLPTGDPRAYLLRRQKSMAAEEGRPGPRKIRRMKSNLMPLENILPDQQLHSVATTLSIGVQSLPGLMEIFRGLDLYVLEGALEDGLDMALEEGRDVEERLKELLTAYTGKENVDDDENVAGINIASLLKGKGAAICS
ncbi:hypothetical protein GGR56DRAFT_222716 [Xylariaceae sp. FL0804]|nr:hypothetical protein GGR56DRAFT_222716 [Xylariaceae sp. FL0804]